MLDQQEWQRRRQQLYAAKFEMVEENCDALWVPQAA
jgi:hypothetical protein